MRPRLAELRQIGIEKTECVRRLDDPDAGGALLFRDLIAKGLHPRPMDFRPEMMLGVVTVKEPDPVVELVVTAHAPGDRLNWVAAVVAVVAVQVRETMAEIPKADQEDDVVPIEDAEGNEGADEKNELRDPPERFPFIFPHKRLENRYGIFAKEAKKCVAER